MTARDELPAFVMGPAGAKLEFTLRTMEDSLEHFSPNVKDEPREGLA